MLITVESNRDAYEALRAVRAYYATGAAPDGQVMAAARGLHHLVSAS